MKPEILARIILIVLLAAAVLVGVISAAPALGLSILPADASTVELHARMPENGGWSLSTLYAEVGQPLRLRMTSDDVLHTFAVGQSDKAPIELNPGAWTETTLVFDKPGRYTYYCTAWCGRNHWRMRGTIEVTGGGGASGSASPDSSETTAGKPLYLRLGLDLDAPHRAEDIPAAPPSVERGAALQAQGGASSRLPAWSLDRQTYLESSPAAVWERLRGEPALKDLTDADLWDAVAYLWARQTAPAQQAEAAKLYATNCAACHGETGKGDGVMVAGLPRYEAGSTHTSPTMDATPGAPSDGGMQGMDGASAGDMRLSAPPDFTDPRNLLGASPALLEGKMLRGGMGTGMPYWGPIFTPSQMDAIIAYLYHFALNGR